MSKRNDPARLEAEAKELYEQMTKSRTETPEVDQPQEDTSEEPEALLVEAPDPTDTVEVQAEEDAVEESERSEDSELKLA